MTDVLAKAEVAETQPQQPPKAPPQDRLKIDIAPLPQVKAASQRVEPPAPVAVDMREPPPSNELAIATWLTDEPQWVHDERNVRSALAVGRLAVHVGDPQGERAVPLSVAGTVTAAGLDVRGNPNGTDGPVRLQGLPQTSQAPVPSRLCSLRIDPVTGQLYVE